MAEKRITFAGSTIGEPWWTLGEIVAKVLEPHGYQVNIVHESFGDNNIPWIASRKADIGAITPTQLWSDSKGTYEKHQGLALIATINRPSGVGLAIRHEIGISDLREVKKRKYPLRILASSPEKGKMLDTVLNYYGMTIEEIESWGGRFIKWLGRTMGDQVRAGTVDMMLGNIYLGYTPHNRYWYDATTLFDMRFLNMDAALVAKIIKKHGYEHATVPHGLYRGLDRDIPSVGTSTVSIYCLESQPAELIRLIAEGLDKNSDLFKNTRSVFYYERNDVWKHPYVQLHAAAEEYYRSRGYMG